MAQARNVYGQVENKTNLKDVFLDIRRDVDTAGKRRDLTELYRRAGYLITLTHAPSWQKKFGKSGSTRMRKVAEDEFARTVRKINRRAQSLGVSADYDEKWGK